MFKEVATSFVNTETEAQANEFNTRRIVLVVPQEYIKYDLGISTFPYTPNVLEHISAELQIRQQIKSKDIVKAVRWDWGTDSLYFYLINPDYEVLPPNLEPPQYVVPL